MKTRLLIMLGIKKKKLGGFYPKRGGRMATNGVLSTFEGERRRKLQNMRRKRELKVICRRKKKLTVKMM